MPVIHNPPYPISNIFLKNSFVQMLIGKFFRPTKKINYKRERIFLEDGDFLDLDWSQSGSKILAIVCDGLEGNSSRHYIKSTINCLNDNQIDTLAINFRGCSGERNKKYFLQYGETQDYESIINHTLETQDYQNIVLIGCSIGGNLVLKYLTEKAEELDKRIKASYTVSPTVDLRSSCEELHTLKGWLVLKGFLLVLFMRVWQMKKSFDKRVHWWHFFFIKNFKSFYDLYVFQQSKLTLDEYFKQNSSFPVLGKVTIPSYILLAMDDPMVDDQFYPYEQARQNQNLILHITKHGGHVGFADFSHKYFWSEYIMMKFLQPFIKDND
jgi:uncharacterized protein